MRNTDYLTGVYKILCCLVFLSFYSESHASGAPCPAYSRPWTDCFGLRTLENGNIYTGQWLSDKPHGKGTLKWASGSQSQYSGEFRFGKPEGTGTLIRYKNKAYFATFSGEFKKGQINGPGEVSYANGDKFVGILTNGKKQTGTYYYNDGSNYEGPFEKGKPHGFGRYVFGKKSKFPGQIYEGFRQMGLMHGEGFLTFNSGSSYRGGFMNNVFHGLGVYNWHSGDSYSGYWENGKQHGKGTYIAADGSIMDGNWNQGEFERQ